MTRKWIKLYCYERLHGSVSFQLTEAEQSVWDKILCLTGLCSISGSISDNSGRAYPHDFIIHELHVNEKLFESALLKCKSEGRISEDEAGIHITNWDKYQSEYNRQKPYQDKYRASKEPTGDSPIFPDADLASVITSYEANIGAITPIVSDKIKDALTDTSAEHIIKAIEIAASSNHRSWSYINGILRKSKESGTPPGTKKDSDDSNSHGGGLSAGHYIVD